MTNAWEGKRYNKELKEFSSLSGMVDLLYKLTDSGIIAAKQSFEDEGVIIDDVITMRRLTLMAELQLFVKIGGPEAITDMNNCAHIGVNTMIAPMVESVFGLRKFVEAANKIENIDLAFVCETKTAYSNIVEMLNSDYGRYLSSVVVGRSDLTKSFDKDKSLVEDPEISDVVYNVMVECKKHGITTTLGGNISIKSKDIISKLYSEELLDRVETRNIVIELNDTNMVDINKTVDDALHFEMEWMNFKANNYIAVGNSYKERAETIGKRLK